MNLNIRWYIMLEDGSSVEKGDNLEVTMENGHVIKGKLYTFSNFGIAVVPEGMDETVEASIMDIHSSNIKSMKRYVEQNSIEICDTRLFVTNEDGGHGFYDSGKIIKVILKDGSERLGRLRVNAKVCDDAITLNAVELFTLDDVPGEVCAVEIKDIQSVRYFFGVGDKLGGVEHV